MEDGQSFIDLINDLYTENRESALNRLINLFKGQKELINLLIKECNLNGEKEFNDLEFLNSLVNLPQITANIFQLLNDPIFTPAKYFNVLCSIIHESLKIVHENLKKGQNQNLSIITQLVGQICFNKNDKIYWSKIGQKILENSKNDLIWRKIGRRLINQQNAFYLEGLIRPLLLNADNYEQIEWYLGKELNKRSNSNKSTIIHLLTNKYLLVNYFPLEKQNLIDNIIGYLINYNLELFKQILLDVISVWSNAALVRHQINDQHFYLCRVLICSLKYMIKLEFKLDVNQFQLLILHAAETHLKMIELDKRNRGLFVVEKLTNYLNEQNAKLEDKLNFEMEFNNEIKFLSEILEEKKTEDKKKAEEKAKFKDNNHECLSSGPEDDENDDLVPFDMSDDLPIIKTKKPIYLKDCLEGLINNENLEYNSICLECLQDLIKKNRTQASELAVDFIRILLFLDIENEDHKEIRFKAMVEFCNLNPVNAAQYLTNQIYDQNLSIIRKLEVLDVIVETAKELSNLHTKLVEDKNIKSIQNIVRDQPKLEYEKIIEERLKSKTKILCSSNRKLQISNKNEFVQYAHQYFYPLINNYDKKDITLKFNEDDYFVLGKLIITLAELLKSVSQTHLTRKMAISLIEFLNVFIKHQETYVRKAITICIHSIITNVPNYFLFEELQSELLSLRDFLVNLKQLDPDCFHSHGVLVLYSLQEQINDYQTRLKNEKSKLQVKI